MTLLELLRAMRDSEGIEIRKHHDGIQIFIRGMPEGADHRDGKHVDAMLVPEALKYDAADVAIDALVTQAFTDARKP